jgi:hypothetical protein
MIRDRYRATGMEFGHFLSQIPPTQLVDWFILSLPEERRTPSRIPPTQLVDCSYHSLHLKRLLSSSFSTVLLAEALKLFKEISETICFIVTSAFELIADAAISQIDVGTV